MKHRSVQWFKDELKHYTENVDQLRNARLRLVEVTNASLGINSPSSVSNVKLENVRDPYKDNNVYYIELIDSIKREISSLEWRLEYVDKTLDRMQTKDREIVRSIYIRSKSYNQAAVDTFFSISGIKKYVNKIINEVLN